MKRVNMNRGNLKNEKGDYGKGLFWKGNSLKKDNSEQEIIEKDCSDQENLKKDNSGRGNSEEGPF